MAKYCLSCGAAMEDGANICTRCGKMISVDVAHSMQSNGSIVPPIYQSELQGKYSQANVQRNDLSQKRRHIILILLVFIAIVFLLWYKFLAVPKLTEEECNSILSKNMQEEKEELEGLFVEKGNHEPIDFAITEISQNGLEADVTCRLSAKYKYATCEILYWYHMSYSNDSKSWQQGEEDDKEIKWNYHDLEGVWQEKDWHQSITIESDDGPSVLSVEKIEDGYRFTATDNWVDKYQGTQLEVTMDEVNSSTTGSVALFPKGYQSEMYFQRYNLSPDEGITDMEKVE